MTPTLEQLYKIVQDLGNLVRRHKHDDVETDSLTITVDLSNDVEGILSVTNGGTGASTLTGLIRGNGTGAFTTVDAPGGQVVGTSDTQTLTNKTIDGDGNTISDIRESMQTLSDNTTNDVSTTRHGYTPKAPNDTTKFLRGDATWAALTAMQKLHAAYNDVATADATETAYFTYTVPANTMGAAGVLHIKIGFSLTMNGNGNFLIRLKFGGTTLGTLTVANSTATASHGYIEAFILNRGATNSQEHFMTLQTSNAGVGTGLTQIFGHNTGSGHTIDTTADQQLQITGQGENAGPVSGTSNVYFVVVTKIV